MGYPAPLRTIIASRSPPGLGIAYSPGEQREDSNSRRLRDVLQRPGARGWATAFQASTIPDGYADSIPAPPALIDPRYKTPYAHPCHRRCQHAINRHWIASADYTYEDGKHGYRGATVSDDPTLRFQVRQPLQLQRAHVARAGQPRLARLSLTAHYTPGQGARPGDASRRTLRLCERVRASADIRSGPGDYGPSGEDVRHRFVLAGTVHIPGGFELHDS